MSDKKNIGILISGRGSNMLNIIRACQKGQINGEIKIVISNKKNAPGLQKAEESGIQTEFVSSRNYPSREEYDQVIVDKLREFKVELVCLAGYMRLLSPVMIKAFPLGIINIHPSLLPAFPGLDAQQQAFEYGVKISGATVHFVDEKLDHGPIILQKAVSIENDDTTESLAERILKVEHEIYPHAVGLFCSNKLLVKDRKVIII